MRDRWRFLVLVIVLLASVPAAVGSDVDVLIVRSGNVMYDQSVMAPDKFVSNYETAIREMDDRLPYDINYDVREVSSETDIGPGEGVMDDYDLVYWYTLNNYEDHPDCGDNGCKAFWGEDRNNIADYLEGGNNADGFGRTIISGHRIEFDNRGGDGADWLKNYFGAQYKSWGDCTLYLGPYGVDTNDILNFGSGSVFGLNSSREGDTIRDYGVSSTAGNGESIGQWQYEAQHPIRDCSSKFTSTEKGNYEAMTGLETSVFKSVYQGFGFESVDSADLTDAYNVLGDTFTYLLGPNAENTTVEPTYVGAQDPRKAPSDSTPEQINISATCRDIQNNGNGVIDAGGILNSTESSKNYIDPARAGDVQFPMTSSSGNFGDLAVNVSKDNIDVSAHADTGSQQGVNVTAFVKCKDDNQDAADVGYWGQYAKDTFIVDIVAPRSGKVTINGLTSPITTDNNITGNRTPPIDIGTGLDEGDTKEFRMACESGQGNSYNDSKINGSFTWTDWHDVDNGKTISWFNLTNSPGCTTGDGKKTVYMQVRDLAGNIDPTQYVTDSIWLDTTAPTYEQATPANKSNLTDQENVSINASDALTQDTELQDINQTLEFLSTGDTSIFNVNTSFIPEWPQTGDTSFDTNVSDLVGNLFTRQLKYTVDPYPPTFSVTPSNKSHITLDTSITLETDDNITSVEYATYNANGTDQSFTSVDTVKPTDPYLGWAEGNQKITLWANDTVSLTNSSLFRFTVDDSPPVVTGITPADDSNITLNQPLTVNLHDPYKAGIDTAYYSIDNNANQSLKINETQTVDWHGEGFTNITIWTNDTLGNSAQYTYEFFVDDAAPVIDAPLPDQLYINNSKKLTVNVTENTSTAGFSDIVVNTENGNTSLSLGGADTRNESKAHIITEKINPDWTTEGHHVITIWANDTAGNEAKETRTYILDTKPDGLELSPQTPSDPGIVAYLNETQQITPDVIPRGAGGEDPAPLDFTQYAFGASNTSFIDEGPFNNPFSQEGNNSILFWINDTADNLVNFNKTFYYDTTPPSLLGQRVANQSYITSNKDLWFAWGDGDGAGVDYVDYRTDGANTTIGANQTFDPGWGESGNADTIRLWGIDEVHNADSVYFEYYVDDTPPTTNDNYSSSQTWVNSDQTVSLTCSDGPFTDDTCTETSYRVYNDSGVLDDSADVSSTEASDESVTISCPTNETCNKTLEYWSTDLAGNEESKNTTYILIDKEAPSTVIDSPAPDELVGENVTFDVSVDDLGVGIDHANFSIVNKSAPGPVQKSGTVYYDQSPAAWWETSGDINNNNFTFKIEANDTFDQINTTQIDFEVDNRRPTIRLQEPSQESYHNDTIDLLFELRTSSDRPLQNASYYIYNETSGNVIDNQTEPNLDTSSYDFTSTLDIANLQDGNLSMNVTGWDNPTSGTPARSYAESWFIIDTQNPAVSISGQQNKSWHEGGISLDYSINDSYLESTSCEYRWDDTDDAGTGGLSCPASTGSFTFESTTCSDDNNPTCRVTVFARDLAGNRATDNLYFKIDNSPPETASVAQPAAGDWFNSDFDFNYTRNDQQGLKNASYRIISPNGGSGWGPASSSYSSNISVDISTDCDTDGETVCEIEVAAYSNTGLVTTNSINVSLDTTPPSFDQKTPVADANITEDDEIDATWSTDDAGIVQASFTSDAVTNRSLLSGARKHGISGDKVDTFTFWLVDEAGNAINEQRTYNIDNTPPIYDSVSEANETNISASDDLTVDFSDGFTGVRQARYDVGDGFINSFESGVAFDPGWGSSQTEQISFRLRDYADNENKTRYEYFVDADDPVIDSINPANDTVITPQDVTIDVYDPSLEVVTSEFNHDDTAGYESFPKNTSFDPGWETEGEHSFDVRLFDTVQNSKERQYQYTIDNSTPTIQQVTLNTSVIADGDTVKITVDATDQYAGVSSVGAELINQTTDTTITSLSFSEEAGSYTATYTATNADVTAVEINVSATDAVGFTAYDISQSFLVDNESPSLQTFDYNVSQDGTGERRIFNGREILVNTTLTDNVTITAANASLTDPSGTTTNISLTEESSWWEAVYADTAANGVYTVDKVWMKDEVDNIGADTVSESFRVVEPTVNTSFNRSLDAGRPVDTNITVDLNKTYDQNLTIYIPPNGPGSVTEEPVLSNTTNLSCTNCNATLVGSHIAAVTRDVNGSINETLNMTFEVATPASDTAYDLQAVVQEFSPLTSFSILAPNPTVGWITCDGSTDCVVSQDVSFDLDANITNTNDTSHNGTLYDPLVTMEANGIDGEETLGDLAIKDSTISTVTVTPTVAGNHSLDVSVNDTTDAYTDTNTTDIWVQDTEKPVIDAVSMATGNSIVNLDTNASIATQATDNIEVKNITLTVEKPLADGSTYRENISTTNLTSGAVDDGEWTASFKNTSLEGDYNVSEVYVRDKQKNERYSSLNVSFDVIEFVLDAFTNINPHADINETVTIGAELSGNSSNIEDVTANISKPRNDYELRNLSFSESTNGGWVYETTYTNTSRSGTYNISIDAAAASVDATNTTAFDVRFGNISHNFTDSNNNTVFPASDTISTYWEINPATGDLVDVNTTIRPGPSMSTSTQSPRELGNITWEQGKKIDSWAVDTADVTTPVKSWIIFETNQSHPTFGHQQETINLSVTINDTAEAPEVTDERTTYDAVNLGQSMPIEGDIESAAPIETVTVTIENTTGTWTRDMTRQGSGVFEAAFIPHATDTYNYSITVTDVFAETDTGAGSSFEATDNLTVSIDSNYDQFNMGDEIEMAVEAEDVNGDAVADYNTTLELDKDGTKETILPENETNKGSYFISSGDPPSGDPTVISYTMEANVTDGRNTGETTRAIDVGNKLSIDWTAPNPDDIVVGDTFDTGFEVTDLRGEPVDGITYVTCGACDTSYRFLDVSGSQYLRQDAFIAPETGDEFFVLSGYANDGLGNRQPVDPNGLSTEQLSISTAEDTSSNDSTSEEGGGGGGFGGGAGPSLEISRIAPSASLPSETTQAELIMSTSLDASCYYNDRPFGETIGEGATSMIRVNGTRHRATVDVEEGETYQYFVRCDTGENGLTQDSQVIFSVASETIQSYDLRTPDTLLTTQQGGTTGDTVSFSNNGTEALTIDMQAVSECCEAWFGDKNDPLTSITVDEGSERNVILQADVPLYVDPGTYSIGLAFTSQATIRERSIDITVEQSNEMKQLEQLEQQSDELEQRIEAYSQAGINTTELERRHSELDSLLSNAQTARTNDDRLVFANVIDQAETGASEIEGRLRALSFQRYVLENWWRWLIGFILSYVSFFLVTIVVVPYYRVKSDYNNVQRKLRTAVDARKKAEKQYFRREIDRDTFMEIMTERQDEILEYRSQRDDLEKTVETVIQDQLTLENVFKAPFMSIREISRWIQARREAE